jgi:hypothetical protein
MQDMKEEWNKGRNYEKKNKVKLSKWNAQ